MQVLRSWQAAIRMRLSDAEFELGGYRCRRINRASKVAAALDDLECGNITRRNQIQILEGLTVTQLRELIARKLMCEPADVRDVRRPYLIKELIDDPMFLNAERTLASIRHWYHCGVAAATDRGEASNSCGPVGAAAGTNRVIGWGVLRTSAPF